MLVLILSCMSAVVHAAQELPGPLTIQVVSTVDARPVAGVTVHVGGRMAVSDQAGKIVFDGVPAGMYDLLCRQPGHQESRQRLELKNGVRVPQTVLPVPEVLSPLKFQFVEEIGGEPVGCARIHMVPKAIPAALQGPMVFSTDGTGKVASIPVPEGVYHLTVEAPGFATLAQDIEHKAAEKAVEFKLKAIARPISCTFAVTGDGGKPLPNAEVELWEVYPLAKIASGKTDAAGVVTFSDLRLGTVNPTTQDKSLPVTHGAEAVVRVQAEGYVTALQSVRVFCKSLWQND